MQTQENSKGANSSPQQKTIQQFIEEHELEMDCQQIGSRPDSLISDQWDKRASHFKINIYRNRLAGFDIYYSMGSAHTEPPQLPDVLDCLASDYAGYKNARDFENWASEYGYDTDSRKAEAIYNTVAEQSMELEELLGIAACNELAFELERL